MGVVAGSPVSAANSNNAWLDANADDTGFGVYALQNTVVGSGSFIVNLQAAVNANTLATGADETDFTVGTTYGATANTIVNGDTHKAALVKVANKFDPSSGHTHDGTAGNGPKIALLNTTGIQLIGFHIQGTNLTGVTGGSTDVSSVMTGQTPSTADTVEGAVVNTPYNYVNVTDMNDSDIFDGGSPIANKVYGRLTWAASVWTLTYYSNVAGTETAYSFSGSNSIKWYYQKLFNETNRPVYDSSQYAYSDQLATTVPDATATVKGKAVLGVHSLSTNTDSTQIIGDVVLEAGTGVTITRTSQTFRIDGSSSTNGYQEVPAGTVNGSNTTFGPLTQTPATPNSIAVYVDGILRTKGVHWNLSGSNIVFTSGNIPQTGQSVYVFYLIVAGPVPAPANVENVEYRTLTSLEVSVKTVVLASTPAAPQKVLVDVVGNNPQQFNVDFTISGNLFQWAGYVLDGVLTAGDVIRFHYWS